MFCPRCLLPMKIAVEPTPKGRVELDYCPRCRGVWFDAQELGQVLGVENPGAFSHGSPLLSEPRPTQLPCPRHGHSPLAERTLVTEQLDKDRGPPLRFEQCLGCEGVWLDGDELAALAERLQTQRVQPFLQNPDTARTSGLALWLFMLLTGLPVEQWNPRVRRPVVTVALIVACTLVFLWQLGVGLEQSVQIGGLYPAQMTLFTLVSSMFLHGSLWHLFGNMYFLWLFGDNVEDRLGRGRALLLYLLSGLGAALCHVLLTGDRHMPVVGASGAISGVMAAYAVLFPQARLISLVILFRVRWRATTYLGMWLVLQVLGALFSDSSIAWWAHIGGFAVGATLARRLRPQPAAVSAPPRLEWR